MERAKPKAQVRTFDSCVCVEGEGGGLGVRVIFEEVITEGYA